MLLCSHFDLQIGYLLYSVNSKRIIVDKNIIPMQSASENSSMLDGPWLMEDRSRVLPMASKDETILSA